jgi:acetyltransferase
MIGDPTQVFDRSNDYLKSHFNPLEFFFHPKTVAVIGATEKEGSVGRSMMVNLTQNAFGGKVFPINPVRETILDLKAYPNIASAPEPVDLAVIVTPAKTVPGLVDECVKAGVKAAIIISAGFKEVGPEGAELERQILEKAKSANMRLIGPNCLGLMNPVSGLNATFAADMALLGSVAFISQSGALITAVLDWSLQEKVGFSSIISLGSMLDVNWGDMINYLGNDPQTHSIVIYMEAIGDARAFLSAAREVALTKPIILIKAGRTEASAKAASSHTGSLAGSDEVLRAAFARCGIMVVDHISHLFYAADTLSKQPRPKGPRLCVVTNAGGPGVLTSDALIEGGGQLANISPETLQALSAFLPSAWSHANPVDVLGDADSTRYAKTLEQVIKDPNNDGVLVILTPQAMTTPAETAKDLAVYHQVDGKPILASWMGGSSVQKGRELLSGAGIPNFPFPDTACRIFNYMWQYSANLKALYETPALPQGSDAPDRAAARTLLQKARSEGRTLLTEYESKKLLEAYGIPTVQTLLAGTADQAASMADSIGYPVVVKLNSTTLTHKTDVGGVRLHLENSSEVKKAFGEILDSITRLKGAQHFQGVTVQPMVKWEGYELILGSSLDPQIGPVLLFGSGGQLVEVYRDHALGLPPLNSTLARRMMEQTKVYKALGGVRGRKSVDLPALEQLMVRFSWLVAEQRWIKELDINPLLASPEGLVALDARVVLHEADMTEDKLPRLAIRPYPIEYVTPWTAADGAKITLRPIRPEDEPLIIKFHETLSEQSVYSRYFENMQWTSRTAHERLTRVCFVDYDRDVVLNAVQQTPSGEAIVGVGRLSRTRLQDEAEFSIIISDHWQKKGLGSEIMSLLLKFGKVEKIHRVVGYTLPENQSMRAICKKFGFKETPIEYNRIIALSLDL